MAYRVEFAARAARDLEILYLEKNAAESRMAARWYNGLEEAVFTLETRPQRCPVAPEAQAAKRTLRHLLYGKKPHVYRVIYEVREQPQPVSVAPIPQAARPKAKAFNLA